MTLEEAREHIGAGVIYQPHPEVRPEDGEIVSVNEHYVFVRYTGDRGAKATDPRNLQLLADTFKESR